MKITIEIECDNAAFREDNGEETSGACGAEIARILRAIAKDCVDGVDAGDNWPAHDVNGNKVGRVVVTP